MVPGFNTDTTNYILSFLGIEALVHFARTSKENYQVVKTNQVLWKERLRQHYPKKYKMFQNYYQNFYSIDSKESEADYYQLFTRYVNEECGSIASSITSLFVDRFSIRTIIAFKEDDGEFVRKAKMGFKKLFQYHGYSISQEQSLFSDWESRHGSQSILNYFFKKAVEAFKRNKSNNGIIDIFTRDHYSHSLLDWAALLNQSSQISSLLKSNLHSAVAENFGRALYIAALVGQAEVVKLLLTAKGIPVNDIQVDMVFEQGTPLCAAVNYGHLKVVELLLAVPGIQVNANPDFQVNAANPSDLIPLHVAAREGHVEVVKRLLDVPEIKVNEIGWDKDYHHEYPLTPLCVAAKNGHVEVVRLLLAVPGIQVNAADLNLLDGNTPLHIAAKKGHVGIARLLLAAGAQVNATRKDGATPLTLAIENDRHDMIDFLLSAKKSNDVQPVKGESNTTKRLRSQLEKEIDKKEEQKSAIKRQKTSSSFDSSNRSLNDDKDDTEMSLEETSLLPSSIMAVENGDTFDPLSAESSNDIQNSTIKSSTSQRKRKATDEKQGSTVERQETSSSSSNPMRFLGYTRSLNEDATPTSDSNKRLRR